MSDTNKQKCQPLREHSAQFIHIAVLRDHTVFSLFHSESAMPRHGTWAENVFSSRFGLARAGYFNLYRWLVFSYFLPGRLGDRDHGSMATRNGEGAVPGV
jgi:hypothetical protein